MESSPTIAKLLKYFLGFGLFSYSFFFSKDVIHKYQEKVSTSWKQNLDEYMHQEVSFWLQSF